MASKTSRSNRPTPAQPNRTRRVAMVLFPDALLLDVAGPLQVFDSATRLLAQGKSGRAPAYEILTLAGRAGPVATSSSVAVVAGRDLALDLPPVDTLLVAGGPGSRAAMKDSALLHWLRFMAPRVRRLGSVCTGAFVLAAAGLLDGRRATTHWASCADLAANFPQVTVEPDSIFVQDGPVHTSAGASAGIDLALALVEADWGREVALAVSRELVVFLKRPGGQSQFSVLLAGQTAERRVLQDLQLWIREHLDHDLSVEALAARVAMSPRSFARAFRAETRTTPGRFVIAARLEAARQLIEENALALDAVAGTCGFGDGEHLRRCFLRHLGVNPSDYRKRFQSTSSPNERPAP